MQKRSILRGAVVALCLIGMLALPAAAAPADQMITTKAAAVDQGLKDDLWTNHQQYRLQQFDLNVQRANSVISILNQYGVDATACQATLSTISSKHSDLETALANKDRESLKTINSDLKSLWKQFMKDVRDAMRNQYRSGVPAGTTLADAAEYGIPGN